MECTQPINLIFKGLSAQYKNAFIRNPETFSGIFIERIKFILADHIALNIKYYIDDKESRLNIQDVFPEEINISQKNKADGNEKSLYDMIEYDSDIEENFLNERLNEVRISWFLHSK